MYTALPIGLQRQSTDSWSQETTGCLPYPILSCLRVSFQRFLTAFVPAFMFLNNQVKLQPKYASYVPGLASVGHVRHRQ